MVSINQSLLNQLLKKLCILKYELDSYTSYSKFYKLH